jgi:hypothetical protein
MADVCTSPCVPANVCSTDHQQSGIMGCSPGEMRPLPRSYLRWYRNYLETFPDGQQVMSHESQKGSERS